ncbi:MAG: formylglycine-generating enzyme family protein [Cyanobacteria bacterium J06639_18]
MAKTIIKYTEKTGQYFVENLGNGVELEMMLIPGGTFIMGAPETEKGSRDSERPQHEVEVPSFSMSKYPVTQAQWKAVAVLDKVERDLEANPSRFKGDRRPVEQVSWYDAVEFCARLSKHTGREYRLPSEAEWEYACRACTTTPFHFGETITSELANYNASSTYGDGPKGKNREKTTLVGSFDVANVFGLYDMHGNVWEWCLDDWHDNYEDAPLDGSAWINKNDNLFQIKGSAVLRGGSWFNYPNYCRSAYRNIIYGSIGRINVNSYIGFRVVCAFGRVLK